MMIMCLHNKLKKHELGVERLCSKASVAGRGGVWKKGDTKRGHCQHLITKTSFSLYLDHYSEWIHLGQVPVVYS